MVDRGNIKNGSGAELGGARFAEKKPTAIEFTHAAIRSRIIEGVYPPGSKLHLEALKSSFGISGSTLREALTRLMSDQLVLTEGQKGFRVTPMSLSDLEDLTNARIKLETSALAESIELGDDVWEDNLITCFHRLAKTQERLEADPAVAFDAWEVRNKEFHEALAAASPSAWLARFRQVLFQNSERYRRISGTMGPIPRDVHNEHEEIFKATIARDTDKAVFALAEHIRRSVNVIREKALLPDD
ncbi:MAG: FCD domain-containing protein [Acidiphilium sp.]|uniref:GntR family transcriptional regulator n=1 Tax=Facivitalis istanbulensis TaxID=3075838 RepID=UPI003474F7B4|nr:FCD domain-containing protein [Acidiphilium sp.]